MEIRRAGFESRKRCGRVRSDRVEERREVRRVEREDAFSMIALGIGSVATFLER